MPLNERDILQLVRLEASRWGVKLFRNNVGAVHTDDGRFIRFGLCNESKAMNEVLKSADLIGIRPLLITPDMVGQTVGQFVAVECKREGWKYTGNPRELSQQNFMELIREAGGNAQFIPSRDVILMWGKEMQAGKI